MAPRLEALKASLHQQWEETNDHEVEGECKLLLRAVVMLDRQFKRDIDGEKVARAKLAERS